MRPTIISLFASVLIMTTAGGAAFAQINGHRPSDHTMDVSNHPFEASVSPSDVRSGSTGVNNFSRISPADRALQRVHDLKQQTSDASVPSSSAPAGMVPVLTSRDRELLRLGTEKDRSTGG